MFGQLHKWRNLTALCLCLALAAPAGCYLDGIPIVVIDATEVAIFGLEIFRQIQVLDELGDLADELDDDDCYWGWCEEEVVVVEHYWW